MVSVIGSVEQGIKIAKTFVLEKKLLNCASTIQKKKLENGFLKMCEMVYVYAKFMECSIR